MSHDPSHHPASHIPARCTHCGAKVDWQAAKQRCPGRRRAETHEPRPAAGTMWAGLCCGGCGKVGFASWADVLAHECPAPRLPAVQIEFSGRSAPPPVKAEPSLAALDCGHCGDVAIESATGMFRDGDGTACVSCGFPGCVFVDDCYDEPTVFWRTSDTDGARCSDAECPGCRPRRCLGCGRQRWAAKAHPCHRCDVRGAV